MCVYIYICMYARINRDIYIRKCRDMYGDLEHTLADMDIQSRDRGCRDSMQRHVGLSGGVGLGVQG